MENLNFVHHPAWQETIKKIYKEDGIDGAKIYTAMFLMSDKRGNIEGKSERDIEKKIWKFANKNRDIISKILLPILTDNEQRMGETS